MVRHTSSTMKPVKKPAPAPAPEKKQMSEQEKELEEMQSHFVRLSLEDLENMYTNLDNEMEKEIQRIRQAYEKRKKGMFLALEKKKRK